MAQDYRIKTEISFCSEKFVQKNYFSNDEEYSKKKESNEMDGSRKKDSVEEEIDGEEKQVRSGKNHCIGQNGQDEGKEQRKDKSKTIVAKLHEKLSFAQSQLQAISQLIAGVNKKQALMPNIGNGGERWRVFAAI